MPELPEVEAYRRRAEAALVGRRIVGVAAAADRIVYQGVAPRRFAAVLRGRRVVAAHRRGKYLWLELDRRPWPLFHFGMTGNVHAYAERRDRPRFWKVELALEDGTRWAMTNKRRLGRIRLQEDPAAEDPVRRLGFDPLLDPLPLRRLAARLAGRAAPIKALLLDQGFAAGVGNWVADEVLFQARIAPRRRACDLTPAEARRLRETLRRVVRRAVRVEADSDRFPRTWLFHRRWGRDPDAVTAAGDPIVFDAIAGRTTAWVPAVQR